MTGPVVGGIDAGGTSWRCVTGSGPDDLCQPLQFATTTPAETLAQAIGYFTTGPGRDVPVIGVGCFGPVAVDPAHPRYGHILATPKDGWSGTDIVHALSRATGKSVVIETDVNAAALAEARWGAARGLTSAAYVTVGTGVGAGILTNGVPLHGGLHPEAGHIRVPRHPDDLAFAGACRFHGDCVEGMASAKAIKERWGADAADLPDNHPAWDIEAHYLAHLAANLILITAVQRVVFGGGVMARRGLAEAIKVRTDALLAGYADPIAAPGQAMVTGAGLGLNSGVLGAIALASDRARSLEA